MASPTPRTVFPHYSAAQSKPHRKKRGGGLPASFFNTRAWADALLNHEHQIAVIVGRRPSTHGISIGDDATGRARLRLSQDRAGLRQAVVIFAVEIRGIRLAQGELGSRRSAARYSLQARHHRD